MKLVALILFTALPSLAFSDFARLYIEPQDGFESYISAALIKKKGPLILTVIKGEAAYILTSAVIKVGESAGGKIARCLAVWCAGIQGTQTATVQLVDPLTNEVLWAYNVRKSGSHNFQSSAEAIAKHLKEFLSKHPQPAKKATP